MIVSKRTDAQTTLSADDLARLEEPILLTAEDMVEKVEKAAEPTPEEQLAKFETELTRRVAESIDKSISERIRAELGAASKVRKVVAKEQDLVYGPDKRVVRVITRETVEE
jgi:hypothetical protein